MDIGKPQRVIEIPDPATVEPLPAEAPAAPEKVPADA